VRTVCGPHRLVADFLRFFLSSLFLSYSSRSSRFTDFRRVLAATNESLTATWDGIAAVINRYNIKPHRVFCLDETHVQPSAKTAERVVVPPSVKAPHQPKQPVLPHVTAVGIINTTGSIVPPLVYVHARKSALHV
jgi:hypothetical protein